MNQVVNPHPRINGYRSHLCDLHCPLADNVASEYCGGLAVGNELAKTGRAAIDNRAGIQQQQVVGLVLRRESDIGND